jgi:acetoin:2,6-dichlorophenolindophenol oxidoreductase subunit beta
MTAETTREITYLEAVREALVQEMRRDEEVFLWERMFGTYGGAFGVSKGMLEEFGPSGCVIPPSQKRRLRVRLPAQRLMGMRPVMEIMFMDFLTISMNQLVNQAAKMRFHVWRQMQHPNGDPSPIRLGHWRSRPTLAEFWKPGLSMSLASRWWRLPPYDAKGLLVSCHPG